jgi:hypothetical protein
VLGFSSCALSKAEFALELRDVVRYLVASQIGINSLMTWPFDDILHGLVISPGVSPQALVGQIVRSFQDFYEPPPVALTALDLGQSRHLKGLVDGVANAVHKILKEFDAGALTKAEREGLHDPVKWLENANKLSPETQVAFFGSLSVYQAFLEALDAFPFEHEDLVDFFDFCLKLVGLNPELGSENLKRAREVAQGILNAGTQPFVAHNVRVGPKLQALNGLSVIAPDFKNENWVTEWEAQRQKEKDEGGECWLWDQTTWPDMVVALFQFSRALPPSIVEQSVD